MAMVALVIQGACLSCCSATSSHVETASPQGLQSQLDAKTPPCTPHAPFRLYSAPASEGAQMGVQASGAAGLNSLADLLFWETVNALTTVNVAGPTVPGNSASA